MPNPPPSNDFSPIYETSSFEKDEKMPDIPTTFLNPINNIQRVFDNQNTASSSGGDTNRHTNDGINLTDIDVEIENNSNINGLGLGDNLESMTNSDEKFYQVNILKTDYYETPNGDVVVRLQPKPLNRESVDVRFEKDHFDIVFQTKDAKFLACHQNSNEDTRFRWTCNLIEPIVPEQCRVRIQSLVEITLRKENPTKKWTSLYDIQQTREKSIVGQLKPVYGSEPRPTATPSILPSTISTAAISKRSTTPTIETPAQQLATLSTKPTCKVTPYNEIGHWVVRGYTGLKNFGNTCFMNASLQALVNTPELREYFLENYYLRDINRTNPLGFKGRLAEAFGQFVNEMWNGMNRFFEPSLLKELVGLKAAQFANFAQHDAQEFLSFLLDGLHEDLNRVGDRKPLTPTVESDGRPDSVVADEAWRYHLMRNDSFVVDLFHGQLKSRLDCPTCGHTSITFDPFVYLPVPFPKSKRQFTFYFWSTDPYAKPIKYTLSFVEDDARVGDVFKRLSSLINLKPDQLRMIEVFRQKIFKRYNVEDRLASIRANDTIFIFQVYDPLEVDEEVVELMIIQRQLHPRMPVSYHCASCEKESQDLRACTKCRTAAYCDVLCQKNDWAKHRLRCRPPSPELVGQPFLISLPKSRMTFRRLMQTLEARARHTLDVFQTPVIDFEMNDRNSNQQQLSALDTESQMSLVSDQGSEIETSDSLIQEKDVVSNAETNCGRPPTKRIRVVFGEPHQQPRSNPLFQLALTNEAGEYVLINGKEKRFNCIDDEKVMEFDKNHDCIAVDWINKKGKNFDHLVVLTKDEMDYVEDGASTGCATSDEQSHQLSELFEHFTETETLSAEDAWYCSRCKEHRQANKTLQLWRLPSILVVQLKRFVYTSSIFRNKIDKHVVYPIRDFDVRPYMCKEVLSDDNVKTIYDLYAVVCHSGTSFFGHYTGFARLPALEDSTKTSIEWRAFDDTNVTQVKHENQLVDGDAYFLFYKKRDNQMASGNFGRYEAPENNDLF